MKRILHRQLHDDAVDEVTERHLLHAATWMIDIPSERRAISKELRTNLVQITELFQLFCGGDDEDASSMDYSEYMTMLEHMGCWKGVGFEAQLKELFLRSNILIKHIDPPESSRRIRHDRRRLSQRRRHRHDRGNEHLTGTGAALSFRDPPHLSKNCHGDAVRRGGSGSGSGRESGGGSGSSGFGSPTSRGGGWGGGSPQRVTAPKSMEDVARLGFDQKKLQFVHHDHFGSGCTAWSGVICVLFVFVAR